MRMGYSLPTVHLIFISTGLSDAPEAMVESALFPDWVAAFLDFEQPADNRQPVTAQSVRMTTSFFIGLGFQFRFIEPFANELLGTIVLDS
jgi:hypothetical protein